ncbi:excinuclease ABC subunit UvrC [Blastochloris viridis]|uniref:UvrABC system protein C n=1 Tax=Blastochloris viridis TaxID=1079 RepID=A0A182D4L5_BLAVI|nr:excinuclease ABC subunit UvrC [Blastochloris viridis]ALK10225.1 UvrABC system protein C [Blastochloris viridis]BAR99841.1 excinuclease ABC subunit C [Blastochloris viridis]
MAGPTRPLNLDPDFDADRREVEAEARAESGSAVGELVEDAIADADFADDAPAEGSLARGTEVIRGHARLAPAGPGVYRMIGEAGEVLYVGKAKSIKKRVLSYARGAGHTNRIARMVALTATMEFVSTRTETEALLLEANLIKRLRPRFNVLLRDDKSFPYILLTGDHQAPQICKHRGARNQPGQYYGPFASVWAVNRTINALQRAFLIRSCSDTVFESRTRPCLLHQIKRCAGPCTGEVSAEGYRKLVAEATAFLSGRSKAVKEHLAADMEAAAEVLDFERAAVLRDRLAALSAIQAHQGVNPAGIEEADVFAIAQNGGQTCVEVFFFRTGQNWGNRAFFPRADRSLEPGEVLASFISQFYDDKPVPRLILVSEALPEAALLEEALSTKAGSRIEIARPQRGPKCELVDDALHNAREALGRRLAESSSQAKLLVALAGAFALPRPPLRVEVYDNSHIMGTNAVGAMVVAGPDGFRKKEYRTFNIRSTDITPGDDFGMMREVLRRRFSRLIKETPRAPAPELQDAEAAPDEAEPADAKWPDLVLIDGGAGQLGAAEAILKELGIEDVALVGIAKGPDRNAGREHFFMPGRTPFQLPPRDPVLYFVQRLRDEAHRFAIGTHRKKRGRDIREGGLQEIPGVGPARKRALLRHFGTLKTVERASIRDLEGVAGINAETAKRIYDFFHDRGG